MARTLADLTLKLSQDLAELEARCAKELDDLEQSRDTALMEIPFAVKVLKTYNQGLAKAKDNQIKAVQKANENRDKEIRTAEDKRRRAVTLAEQRHRASKKTAFRRLQLSLRAAKSKWKAAIEKIRRRPLSEQRSLRKAADNTYEAAVETARGKYQDAIEEARLSHQSKLQDLLAEERYSFERANRTAERMITSAVVAFEREVAREEARMRGELAKDPEARKITEAHDRLLAKSRRDCARKKEALFKKFSADRKKLRR